MFIAIQELERHPVRFNVDLPAGVVSFEDDHMRQASSLHAEGSAQLLNRSLGEIRIHGDLKVTMEATCDRCLETAPYTMDDKFDLVYMPSSVARSGGEDEVDQAALEIGYYDGAGIALNDVLREVVLLALPMQLVCGEDCKGICPVCGKNLNQGACGCHPQAADDRWSKLKEFRAEIGPHN